MRKKKRRTRPIGPRRILGGGRWTSEDGGDDGGGAGGAGGGGSGRGNSWDDPLRSYSRIFVFYEKA